jgi:hypothetical protein
LFIAVLFTGIPPATSFADDSRWVNFQIPWDDATPNVATDVSHLNNKNLPRLTVKDGQFVEADSGKRIRFWGTNLCFGENFPEKADADRVASHMAKYGINLVRLHHFDSEFAMQNGSSIWDRHQAKKVIDPIQLDRQQYLIAALAKHGIYIDMNLKVSKEINKIDGAALDSKDSSRSFSTSYQKVIDRFDPFLIEHQKWFARQILTKPNPYRNNLTLVHDPVMALVELNNENAAGGWPGEGPGANLYNLPEPYAKTIKTMWTKYLKDKYHIGEPRREKSAKIYWLTLPMPGGLTPQPVQQKSPLNPHRPQVPPSSISHKPQALIGMHKLPSKHPSCLPVRPTPSHSPHTLHHHASSASPLIATARTMTIKAWQAASN